MINTRELMLGNWVECSVTNPLNEQAGFISQYARIHNIRNCEVHLLLRDGSIKGRYSSQLLNPIELTADVLNKFGFIDTHGYGFFDAFFHEYGTFSIELNAANKTIKVSDAMSLLAHDIPAELHRLQNILFALTGKELAPVSPNCLPFSNPLPQVKKLFLNH